MNASRLSRDEILARLDKVAFYAEHIADFRPNGKAEVRCTCPFHDDRHPSLDVNQETGLFVCRSCQAGGSPIDFLVKLHGVSVGEALSNISERVGGRPTPRIGAATKTSPKKNATKVLAEEIVKGDGEPHLTDLGNAEVFAAENHEQIRYAHDRREWYVNVGTHWAGNTTGEILRLARETVGWMYARAIYAPDIEKRQALVKHALSSESAKRIAAMVDLARHDARVAITSERFDRNPWHLNFTNGTLDLETGELRPHDPANMLSYCLDVAYDPQAACPLFENFLLEVFERNFELIDWVQRAVGYSLTGSTREEVFFLLYGTGSNGKTTLLETIKAALQSLAITANFETFLTRDRRGGASEDLARLAGKRMVIASEADAGRRLDENKIKLLTGGDTVTARHLFKGSFDFAPAFKLWLATNHRPRVDGTDPAIWRRPRLIPFKAKFEGDQRDDKLKAKLLGELPGVIAWSVAGCREWVRRPLRVDEPAAVRVAGEEYRKDSDTLGDFLEAKCVLAPGAWIESGALYAVYNAWAKSSGYEPMAQKTLTSRLTERSDGISSDRRFGGRGLAGITLQDREHGA